MYNFQVKTKIIHGENSLSYLEKLKRKNIWIICDPFLVDSPNMKKLLDVLDATNQVDVFSDVVPDPPIEKVAIGVLEAKKIQAEIMIAFGGGSAIDTAKGIYHFANMLVRTQIKKFIAIPTTSGSGSEVTMATVITDPSARIKYPLFSEELIPDVAILDANLVTTVPPTITANTGMDVLTHAIEAYVSIKACDCTDALAEKSVQLTLTHLLDCFYDGTNTKARTKMHRASTMAGMAFNITNLGINHSIAHQLGAQFHIPHGLANAMLLVPVIQFNAMNSERAKAKYANLARISAVASHTDSDELAIDLLCEKIDSLMVNMKMSKTLLDVGITRDQISPVLNNMIENAMKDSCFSTTPVKPTIQDIKGIIEKLQKAILL